MWCGVVWSGLIWSGLVCKDSQGELVFLIKGFLGPLMVRMAYMHVYIREIWDVTPVHRQTDRQTDRHWKVEQKSVWTESAICVIPSCLESLIVLNSIIWVKLAAFSNNSSWCDIKEVEGNVTKCLATVAKPWGNIPQEKCNVSIVKAWMWAQAYTSNIWNFRLERF